MFYCYGISNSREKLFRIALSGLFLLWASRASAQDLDCGSAPEFNKYMCQSYQLLLKKRANLGWSEAPAMTRSYPFGSAQHGEVKASTVHDPRPATDISCNGAMLEALVVALTLYAKDVPTWQPSASIPLAELNKQKLTSLRGNIMMVEATDMPPFSGLKFSKEQLAAARTIQSSSIAQGLQKFGIADPVTEKSKYAVGDIVTLSRKVSVLDRDGKVVKAAPSGHSGMFVGWLGAGQDLLRSQAYDPAAVKGFVYFSSQSNYVRAGDALKKASGLGLRAAYFTGFCPQDPSNKLDPGKANCRDQRVQDEEDYRSAYAKYSKSFPKMTGDLKPDCCVDPDSLRVGRVRPVGKWEYATAAPRVSADCDAVAIKLVGKKCPKP